MSSSADPNYAAEAFGWLLAYQEAGFTRDEAVQLVAAVLSAPRRDQYPPEFLEFLAKQSRVAERVLEDDLT